MPCVLTARARLTRRHAAQKWGWVLEMYGFTIACYNAGIAPATLHIKMMSQPPWDTKLWPYYLLHFTYGAPCPPPTGALTGACRRLTRTCRRCHCAKLLGLGEGFS